MVGSIRKDTTMPRPTRSWTHQDVGCYHITSRIADRTVSLEDEEKEHFLSLLERLSHGYYVQIHAFCIMDNHFHILATGLEEDAKRASWGELLSRYRKMYGRRSDPPVGRRESDGDIDPDPDEGKERLRRRLGSISRFVQELKQTFSRWYNARNEREGYLWGNRFGGVLVGKRGYGQATVSAYIDLNPVRAGMVEEPEEYRWSGMGMRVRSPGRARRLLTKLWRRDVQDAEWYRGFVYETGTIEVSGKGHIDPEVLERCRRLGVAGRLKYRCRNISEGIAIGTAGFIRSIQMRLGRKRIRARSFMQGEGPRGGPHSDVENEPYSGLFVTRVLRQ